MSADRISSPQAPNPWIRAEYHIVATMRSCHDSNHDGYDGPDPIVKDQAQRQRFFAAIVTAALRGRIVPFEAGLLGIFSRSKKIMKFS